MKVETQCPVHRRKRKKLELQRDISLRDATQLCGYEMLL